MGYCTFPTPTPPCNCQELTERIEALENWRGETETWKTNLESWKNELDGWRAEIDEKLADLSREIAKIWENIKEIQERLGQLARKIGFLDYLPRGLRKQMVCDHLKNNPDESPLTEFGLTCELKDKKKKDSCICH